MTQGDLGHVLARRLRSDLGRSVVVGVVAFVLVLVIGAASVVGANHRWTATTTLVLLPGKSIDASDAAGYFDTLSSGQITQTASQILDLGRFKQTAAKQLHLSSGAASSATVTVNVVTGSSIVTLAVSAPSSSVAERLADTVVDNATSTVNSLIAPYQISVVSSAAGTATSASGLGTSKLLVILLLVGLALGLGLQQATYQLVPLVRRVRGRPEPAVRDRPEPAERRRGRRLEGRRPSGAPVPARATRRTKVAKVHSPGNGRAGAPHPGAKVPPRERPARPPVASGRHRS